MKRACRASGESARLMVMQEQELNSSTFDLRPPQFLIDASGNKAFVVLTTEQYEALLEDLHDLAVMARMPLDQFEEGLRADGYLSS